MPARSQRPPFSQVSQNLNQNLLQPPLDFSKAVIICNRIQSKRVTVSQSPSMRYPFPFRPLLYLAHDILQNDGFEFGANGLPAGVLIRLHLSTRPRRHYLGLPDDTELLVEI